MKSLVRVFLVTVVVGFSLARLASASDHIDGPVTKANAVADITDFFMYPTPGNPERLTLVLDVYPFVSATGHFSDKVNYNFILRKASIAPDGSRILTDAASEVVITCRFITPQQVSGTQVLCASHEPRPRVIGQIAFNEKAQRLVGNSIELFGGRRADPFFLSAGFAGGYMQFQNPKPDGVNVMNNLNVLSIVMNVDVNQLFPRNGQAAATSKSKAPNRKVAQVETFLIAASVESIGFDQPGGVGHRIDRVGRPEITNVSMNMKTSDPEIRDTYNSDRPFEVSGERQAAYIARLTKNISHYDQIDGHQDWSANKLSQLTTILTDDFLVVDPFTPCTRSSFFEIERAMILNQPHQSCGGRDPNDNAVNKMYTLYEKGAAAMPSISINDGLKGPSKPISNAFPYLADPYDGFVAWMTEQFAKTVKDFL